MMMFMMPMMGMMGGMDGTGMTMSPVWGIAMMLLFLFVLLGIGYALYRAFTSETVAPSDPALEELRVAYARGELTQEEFEQRQEDLKQTD
jgi:putative membrane protein